MEQPRLAVALALAAIELRSLEGRRRRRIGQPASSLRGRDAGKLAEELHASAPHLTGQLLPVIGEVQKGARRTELLTLEEHGRCRPQQQHRRQRSQARRTGQPMDTLPAQRVGDLIVILDEGHEASRGQVEGRGSPFLACHR